jgi:hypothetical protein
MCVDAICERIETGDELASGVLVIGSTNTLQVTCHDGTEWLHDGTRWTVTRGPLPRDGLEKLDWVKRELTEIEALADRQLGKCLSDGRCGDGPMKRGNRK